MIILLFGRLYVVDASDFRQRMERAKSLHGIHYKVYMDEVTDWIKTHTTLDVAFYDVDNVI